MPVLKKCCFCIELPLGGIILGSLSLLAYAIVAIICGLGLFASYQKEVEDSLMEKYEKTPEVLPAMRIVLWIVLIICLLLAMVSVLMIVGSEKRKSKYVQPYVILSIIGVAFSVFQVIHVLAMGSPATQHQDPLMMIVELALQIYFTLCAYALHQQLREEEKEARQNPYARVVKV